MTICASIKGKSEIAKYRKDRFIIEKHYPQMDADERRWVKTVGEASLPRLGRPEGTHLERIDKADH